MTKKTNLQHDAIIEIYHKDGNNGVRVQALGEDFVIGLHDIDDGKDDFNYDMAMSRLKELNLSTFSRKQASIIGIYIDQIDDKLVEADGEAFTEDFYITNELYIPRDKRSSADYNANSTWYFFGSSGDIGYISRYGRQSRCRPILDLNFCDQKKK